MCCIFSVCFRWLSLCPPDVLTSPLKTECLTLKILVQHNLLIYLQTSSSLATIETTQCCPIIVCIAPFELLRHLVWRFYSCLPAFQLSPHSISDIYSALLTQGWSLTEVLPKVYSGVLHLQK